MKRYIKSNTSERDINSWTINELVERINNISKQYGRAIANKACASAFENGNWYREDKRKSGVQFAIEIVSNGNYTVGLPSYHDVMYILPYDTSNRSNSETNADILNTISQAEKDAEWYASRKSK